MTRCVLRMAVDGATVPYSTVRPASSWDQWCEEQGIDPDLIQTVEVTQDDEGRLTAYFHRYETEKVDGRVQIKPFRADYIFTGRMRRTYLTHQPVTSIQTLLDGLDGAPDEFVEPESMVTV